MNNFLVNFGPVLIQIRLSKVVALRVSCCVLDEASGVGVKTNDF